MPDQFALRLFHKSDIRADVSFFKPETVTGLTHAEALFLKDSSISHLVLARDARLSGAAILSLKTEIFTSLGFDVYVIPAPASTPYFYHTVRQLKGAAGIMVTASHNPGNYNGEKLVLPGPFPIADNSGLEIIKKYFEKGRRAESATSGRVYFHSVLPQTFSQEAEPTPQHPSCPGWIMPVFPTSFPTAIFPSAIPTRQR